MEGSRKETSMTPRVLNRREAAAYLGISKKTLDRWTGRGVIGPLQFPSRRVAYDRRDLDRLIEDSKTVPEIVP